MRIMLFFQPIYALLQFFLNLPIMLSDFPIMLRGFTYYAQILNEKYTFYATKYTDKCWSVTDGGLTRHFQAYRVF